MPCSQSTKILKLEGCLDIGVKSISFARRVGDGLLKIAVNPVRDTSLQLYVSEYLPFSPYKPLLTQKGTRASGRIL